MSSTTMMQAGSLHRILYNTKLFQTGKIKNPALMTLGTATVTIEVDDRLTYIRDEAETEPSSVNHQRFELTAEQVKEMELYLRDLKDTDPVTLVHTLTDRTFSVDGTAYEIKQTGEHSFVGMWNPTKWDAPEYDTFEIWGDRWRKMSLIQPQDYPQSFRAVKHETYGDILLFKIGPTLRGAMSLVDHKELRSRVDASEILC